MSVKLNDLLLSYIGWLTWRAERLTGSERQKLRDLAKNTRSSFRRFEMLMNTAAEAIDAHEFAKDFQAHADAMANSAENAKSASAHVSRVKWALLWGAAAGLLSACRTRLQEFEYPQPVEWHGDKCEGIAADFTARFFSYLCMARISARNVKRRDLDAFMARCTLPFKQIATAERDFLVHWNDFAHTIGADNLGKALSKRQARDDYGARMDDLSPNLRRELEEMQATLLRPPLRARHGNRPLSSASVKLCLSFVLELIGFCGMRDLAKLETTNLSELITIPHVLAFRDFLNARSLKRCAATVPLNPSTEVKYGYSERTMVWQICLVARRVLRDGQLREELGRMHRNMRRNVESRRENYKDIGFLNDCFVIAARLLEWSDEPPRQGLGRLQRAMLRRDALIFTLLGLFCYRRGIISKLPQASVSVEDGGVPTLSVAKRRTKTRKNNHWHEVPEEARFLLFQYRDVEREILRDGKDCKTFFIGMCGAPLSPAGVSDVVKERTMQVLGLQRNVHLVRKCWITEFLNWSDGDYLMASMIADNSRKTMEMYYQKANRAARIQKHFDPSRRAAAMRARAELEASSYGERHNV